MAEHQNVRSNSRAMHIRHLSIALLAAYIASACGVATTARPDAYYGYAASTPTSTPDSLFPGDGVTLSDEAINTILDYKYTPPPLSRIALMPFGRELRSMWSEELSLATDEMQSEVIARLRSSAKVYDASYLPSILIPEKRTVPHLREAAARYQADLLLAYRTYCQTFDKYRLFAPEISRAYCGAEAVLLDTRTGLVPFTAVATHTYDVVESKTDINDRETRLRAQLAATAQALGQVSAEVVRFLDESE